MNTAAKRISSAVILAVFVLGLSTCKKEKLEPPTVKLFDEETITVSYTQAIVSAEVTDQGGAEVKSRGFAYGKGGGALDTVFCGIGTGVYSAELNNLEPNTAYVYEAFAKNEYGMGTSGKVTFTTRDYELPIVETGEVADTTATTATCSGNVTGDGGSTVMERGFCWSTHHAPKIYDSHIQVGEGTGVFTWTLTDLQPDTTYYVCAYATNSKGTNYGTEKCFQTKALYYTINVSANPSQSGNVSGNGIYTYEEDCTVTAIANSGYDFENWTENGEIVSEETEYTFTVKTNRDLVANFSAQVYTVTATVEPENGGTVVSGPGEYNYNDSCTLKARANDGYIFEKWTKYGTVVSTDSTYTFQVTESTAYVAHFRQQTYTISVSASPGSGGVPYVGNTPGTTSGTYTSGQSCTVHANPNSGYTFANWTENGNVVSTQANYTFTVSGSRNLVAHYTANPQTYTISVSASPSSGGAPYVGNTPGATSGTYTSGQSCTVHANPNSGYTFANWTENGNVVSTQANYTFTVSGSRNLVAHYTANPQTYTISVSASPSSGGAPYVGNTPGNTSGTYTSGQSCTVHANPNSGYTFANWTENGNVVSTQANYTFTVNGNRTLVANFTYVPPTYTITVYANPTNGGTVTGGGTYNYGATVNLTANAYSGFTFGHWQDGNTNNPRTITVTGNATYTAYFEAQPQAPVGAINGLFTINSNGDQVYFSRGNLQYNKTTQEWSFMEHQYDMVESFGQDVGENYANQNIVSLFGWGTSGWSNGNVYYQPYDTQNNGNNSQGLGYGPTDGTSYAYDLTGNYASSDWGVNNPINNGGNMPNQWRTLTQPQWNYVFNGRSGALSKYGHGKVNGVNGVILLPDEWTLPSGLSFIAGNSSWSNVSNVYTTEQWEQMEQNGAVFLPAAHARLNTVVDGGDDYGDYWTASHGSTNQGASAVRFGNNYLYSNPSNNYRPFGFSVRLVRSAQ